MSKFSEEAICIAEALGFNSRNSVYDLVNMLAEEVTRLRTISQISQKISQSREESQQGEEDVGTDKGSGVEGSRGNVSGVITSRRGRPAKRN